MKVSVSNVLNLYHQLNLRQQERFLIKASCYYEEFYKRQSPLNKIRDILYTLDEYERIDIIKALSKEFRTSDEWHSLIKSINE